ncbi:GNAT family N-acetyltransferase [Glutamicibacter sp. JL.03c]|uniref:GNAT family N-acetyltransferase n=1 Tax=Glutamicibacter sp. JL.03c TaxID=2984842 RepID=UPI0021F6A56B|nr:GNAT family N-acetyltransferase [Glutamicibacter sp. JL.03c]UYQ76492.1 GNAT family N-acetyltransferase [Glutamicibacter sp. JL.03c]
MLAFADVIIGWPEPETAHIGLLMTDSERVGEGLGRRLHESIVTELRGAEGLCCLRLAIVDANADVAEPFWKKMGYQPTSQVAPHRQGTVESASRIWRRQLGCGAEASAGTI